MRLNNIHIDLNNCRIELIHSLIDLYGHFADINNALNMFDAIKNENKNTVSLNVILKTLIC